MPSNNVVTLFIGNKVFSLIFFDWKIDVVLDIQQKNNYKHIQDVWKKSGTSELGIPITGPTFSRQLVRFHVVFRPSHISFMGLINFNNSKNA